MTEPTATLTPEQIRALVSEGVQDAFTKMGIEADDPLEMQRDFQHLREWRVNYEEVKRKGFLAAAGIVATGVLAALWAGIKAAVHGG